MAKFKTMQEQLLFFCPSKATLIDDHISIVLYVSLDQNVI